MKKGLNLIQIPLHKIGFMGSCYYKEKEYLVTAKVTYAYVEGELQEYIYIRPNEYRENASNEGIELLSSTMVKINFKIECKNKHYE